MGFPLKIRGGTREPDPRRRHLRVSTMKLPAHGRYPHSALPHRPVYDWPGGKRLAVGHIQQTSSISPSAPVLGSDSAQPGAAQTQRNYAWRDYGNRVGLWYLLDPTRRDGAALLAQRQRGGTRPLPGDRPPPCSRAATRWSGTARTNAERQDQLWEDDERRLIQQSRDAILRHGGTPAGWLGPYITQSAQTLDLLKEEGFQLRAGLAGRRPAVLDDDPGRPDPLGPPTRSRSTTARP